MRHLAPSLTLAFLSTLVLVACGGGSSSGGGGNGPTNSPPTASAGTNQTVSAGATVTLNGTASSDSDGTVATYLWTQTAGTAVTLTGAATAQPTFVAPQVTVATALTFSLIVNDNRFAASSASTVTITVNPVANVAPTANAGPDQSVTSGAAVTLNGMASADSDGSIQSYAWTQTTGIPVVSLTGASTSQPTFTAPTVVTNTTFTFSLIVTDNRSAASTADTVVITVTAPVAGTSDITGTVTFARIPETTTAGLNYASPTQQPARAVLVRAINTANQAVLASTSTSATGTYTLNVANGLTVRVEAVSQMTRTGALPNWNFVAKSGTDPATLPYVYTDGTTFSSTGGGVHNVAIPSGFDNTGAVTGTRASAPFAVLDTVYQGVQTILGVAPTTNFPALVLNWATGNAAGETFFTTDPVQNIVLSADVTADTDEFDQHVIAHEFGHYIENNFSRADNIGGAHGLGDKLDIRVAFGEGFGYAFAGIVLNDPVAIDSYVGGTGAGCNATTTRCSSVFNIETNPSTAPPGTPAGNYGCWCSESTVWSLLWDIYDSAGDTNDTVSLGFAPMWNVLIGAQKSTPAFTSIFSFVTALKAANPASAAAIDTLVAAQNITSSTMDIYGSTETHVPTTFATVDALPVYAAATVGGGPVIVQNGNKAGHYNTLGNHSYIKFTVASSRVVTITVTTSNPATTADPDFLLFEKGVLVTAAEGTAMGTETTSLTLQPSTYVLDAYDCANGCSSVEGTPGNYQLTVTIN